MRTRPVNNTDAGFRRHYVGRWGRTCSRQMVSFRNALPVHFWHETQWQRSEATALLPLVSTFTLPQRHVVVLSALEPIVQGSCRSSVCWYPGCMNGVRSPGIPNCFSQIQSRLYSAGFYMNRKILGLYKAWSFSTVLSIMGRKP